MQFCCTIMVEQNTLKNGRIEQFSLTSQALQDNRLGDPATREVVVYVPAGYDDDAARHYGVIYLLPSHGRTSHYYTSWNQWDERIQDRLDRLMSTGVMEPVLVVLPDCWTRLGGSQFLDSPIGNYRSYLVNEIIPAIDARYRTISDRNGRAVCGHSSGGYGAITLAMTLPDVFSAVGARAPDMYWEYAVMPMMAELPAQLEKWGGFAAFIDAVPTIHPKRRDFWGAIHTVMQCMIYGANPKSPFGFDSPIDLETGAMIPEVWAQWLTYDPVRMVEVQEHQMALRSMNRIFLDVGTFDEYHLRTGARLFHQKLTELAISHHYEEFLDGHNSTSYRFDVMLPILADAIQP